MTALDPPRACDPGRSGGRTRSLALPTRSRQRGSHGRRVAGDDDAGHGLVVWVVRQESSSTPPRRPRRSAPDEVVRSPSAASSESATPRSCRRRRPARLSRPRGSPRRTPSQTPPPDRIRTGRPRPRSRAGRRRDRLRQSLRRPVSAARQAASTRGRHSERGPMQQHGQEQPALPSPWREAKGDTAHRRARMLTIRLGADATSAGFQYIAHVDVVVVVGGGRPAVGHAPPALAPRSTDQMLLAKMT